PLSLAFAMQQWFNSRFLKRRIGMTAIRILRRSSAVRTGRGPVLRVTVLVVVAALLLFAHSVRAADSVAFANAVDLSPLRTVAVQHRQTLKTLDSYARQTLSAITNRSSLRAEDSLDGQSHDALFAVLDIAYHPDEYGKRNLIKIRNVPL